MHLKCFKFLIRQTKGPTKDNCSIAVDLIKRLEKIRRYQVDISYYLLFRLSLKIKSSTHTDCILLTFKMIKKIIPNFVRINKTPTKDCFLKSKFA